MRIRTLIMMLAGVCAFSAAYAEQVPTAEPRGDFVKIFARDYVPDVPNDRGAPRHLYVRKSLIDRVSIMYAGRSTEFVVEIVTSGLSDHPAATGETFTTYHYRFPSEASATAFCETILFGGKASVK